MLPAAVLTVLHRNICTRQKRRVLHLVVAQLEVQVLHAAAVGAAPVPAEQRVAAHEVERACSQTRRKFLRGQKWKTSPPLVCSSSAAAVAASHAQAHRIAIQEAVLAVSSAQSGCSVYLRPARRPALPLPAARAPACSRPAGGRSPASGTAAPTCALFAGTVTCVSEKCSRILSLGRAVQHGVQPVSTARCHFHLMSSRCACTSSRHTSGPTC